MRADLLRLGEWLRRIGVHGRHGWAPEMAEYVQPVAVVHDGSHLVPPLLPAAAFAGGQFLVPALEFAALEFHSRAAGGAFLRTVTASGPAGGSAQFRYRLNTAATTFSASSLLTANNFGSVPVVSTLRIGSLAAATLGVLDAQRFNFEMVAWVDEFYIPPGSFLLIEGAFVNVDVAWSMLWTEVQDGI